MTFDTHTKTNLTRLTKVIAAVSLILAAVVPTGVEAKNELIDGGGSGALGNKLPSAPVMNNDGEVAYRKNFGLIIIGGASRAIRRSTANGVPVGTKTIVGNNQNAPSGVGKFSTFSEDGQQSIGLRLNDIGQRGGHGVVMFHSFLSGIGVNSSNNAGIYTVAESTSGQVFLGEVARKGDSYNTAGDKYIIFQAMGIDRIGEPAYLGSVDRNAFGAPNESVIFRKQRAVLEVVDSGDGAPGGGLFQSLGLFQGTYRIVTNNKTSQLNSEKIAFYATLSGTSSSTNTGVYRGSGPGQITQMAREGQTLFGGSVSVLTHPDINDNGWVAYNALRFFAPSDSRDGIFAGDTSGAGIATLGVALAGDAIPGGGFVYTGFGLEPDVNNLNHIAYSAFFNGPSNHNNGIYRRSTGPSETTIAEEGDFPDIPGPNNRAFVGTLGQLGQLSQFTLNDVNQIAFVANLDNGSGGTNKGIYIGVGGNKKPIEIARVGQVIDGKTISDLEVNLGVDVGGSTGFNNNGQVAFLAKFTDGSQRIYRHTPTLKISALSSDTIISWANASKWNLEMVPGADSGIYEVAIGDDPTALPRLGLTVEGPTTATTVAKLSLGSEVGFNPQPEPPKVHLMFMEGPANAPSPESPAGASPRSAPFLTVLGGVDISANGILTVEGDNGATQLPAVQVGQDIINRGKIQLAQGGEIGGQGVLFNLNTLQGDGTIYPVLDNIRASTVLVSNGESLRFIHTAMTNMNNGMITVEDGGAIQFSGDLTNMSLGEIQLGNAAVLSVQSLVNDGMIRGGGQLKVLGNLSGVGGFGNGSVNIAGQLMPANGQIGDMSFGGDLSLGATAALEIGFDRLRSAATPDTAPAQAPEAGTTALIHDTVQVQGTATLAGTLEVVIKQNRANRLNYGDEFVILTADTRVGEFDQVTGVFFTNPDLTLAPVYDHKNNIGVTLVAALPGDATLDDTVNGDDLLVWQANLFSGDEFIQGDFNLDGNVNGDDLLIWQAHLFDTVPLPSSATSPIPEPGTAVLLFGLGVLSMATRHRTA